MYFPIVGLCVVVAALHTLPPWVVALVLACLAVRTRTVNLPLYCGLLVTVWETSGTHTLVCLIGLAALAYDVSMRF